MVVSWRFGSGFAGRFDITGAFGKVAAGNGAQDVLGVLGTGELSHEVMEDEGESDGVVEQFRDKELQGSSARPSLNDGVSSRRSLYGAIISSDGALDKLDSTLTHLIPKRSTSSLVVFASSGGLLSLNPLSSTQTVSESMVRATSSPFLTLDWPPDELPELWLHEGRYLSL